MRQPCGPRYDLGGFPANKVGELDFYGILARGAIAAARRSLPTLPNIHFNWFHSTDLNAIAFHYQGRFFIGLSTGVVFLTQLLMSRLLSHPSVLSHVGQPSRETPPPPLTGFGPDLLAMVKAGQGVSLPADPDRGRYALHLSGLAINFLVFHELTHIVHGHLGLIADRTGFSFVSEKGWSKGTAMSDITSQTLEMDADCGATCCQVSDIWQAESIGAMPYPLWRTMWRDAPAALFDWAYAVSLLFRTFGDDMFPGIDLVNSPYPPFRVRQMIALSTAGTYMINQWGEARAREYSTHLISGMARAEKGYELITGEAPSAVGVELASKEGWEHVRDTLRTHWTASLRSELQPFAYSRLPD